MQGIVTAVSCSPDHTLRKENRDCIRLLAGLGVEGDAHFGRTVQHLSRVAADPSQPNLRQVHLIHGELLDELLAGGFVILPGDMGENITTRGVDLPSLPRNTRLHIGDAVVVEVTGLRNPCAQLDGIQPGLMKAVSSRDVDGKLTGKAGVMGVVIVGGEVTAGDSIRVERPQGTHEVLERV